MDSKQRLESSFQQAVKQCIHPVLDFYQCAKQCLYIVWKVSLSLKKQIVIIKCSQNLAPAN